MEIKQLHTFITLCQLQNFTKTAAELHYAQSNVTTQIQQLENELGVKLFERLGHHVALTHKGKELLPYARQILLLNEEAKNRLSEVRNGQLTIAASESLCVYRLSSVLKLFRTEHPEIELHLQMLDTSDFTPLLAQNVVDAAFVLELPVSHPALEIAYKKREDIGIFALPSHSLANKASLKASDFQHQAFILTGQGCCYRKLFLEAMALANVSPTIVLETSSLQVIKETALSGLGLCVLPLMAVEKELQEQKLIQLPYHLDFPILSQLIYHKDKWISPELTAFINLLLHSL